MSDKKKKSPARGIISASEAEEQKALFSWAEVISAKHPETALMYHIPNGGSRNKCEAANLKRQGVKAGVPDICLPVARGEYHGLFIEMKVGRNKPTDKQREWITALREQGYVAEVCRSWESAAAVIEAYLKL